MGFTVDTVLLLNGTEAKDVYYTFQATSEQNPAYWNNKPLVRQAGATDKPLVQRVPLCTGDKFVAGTTFYWTFSDGDATQTCVWYNTGSTPAPDTKLDTCEVPVTLSDTSDVVARKTTEALVAHGYVSTSESQYYTELTNHVVGNVAVADLSTMPSYRRYIVRGKWKAYASVNWRSMAQPELESATLVLDTPVFAANPLAALYADFMSNARFTGRVLTVVEEV